MYVHTTSKQKSAALDKSKIYDIQNRKQKSAG
jgi:hypothetical protein